MEDGGKGILFTVNADNSVTGREMPAQVIQMLMQTRSAEASHPVLEGIRRTRYDKVVFES